MSDPERSSGSDRGEKEGRRILADFALPSEPGNEREEVALVVEEVWGLPPGMIG